MAKQPTHPLSPAAVRVERTTSKGEHGVAHQTALTMWFGEGPALPTPGGGQSMRAVVGTIAGVAGMVALGALGVIASQREQRLEAAPALRRLTQTLAPLGAEGTGRPGGAMGDPPGP